MKSKSILLSAIILGTGVILAYFIMRIEPKGATDEHGHAEHAGHDDHAEHGTDMPAKELERGPHGGRLLKDNDLGLELSIFETGVSPQFRAYFFDHKKPISPKGLRLVVELYRLGGRVDTINFSLQGEFMLGNRTVEEPHSFDVKINLESNGTKHQWEYSQVEGRVNIAPEAIEASGIEVEIAGPAVMKSTLHLNGKIIANEDRLAHIFARFPGVVKEVRKHLGESVKKGDVLAIIESNETLEAYSVISQIEGTVIRKHITAGETVGAEVELYAITDLSSVWADFSVYRQDFPRLRKGQKVWVDAVDHTTPLLSSLIYLSPIGAEHTQTMTARAALPNRGGQWPPGLFVKGEVVLEEYKVPVAIKAMALQTFRDWEVVFIKVGTTFEARPLELGRRDNQWIEVLAGLRAGEEYVTENSFVVKADIGKAGASHDH